MIAFSRRMGLVMAAALALSACGDKEPAGVTMADMSLGKADAPVKVVEYASLSCNHCARFNNDVLPQFKEKYVDTGLVHYTYREFLTEPVPLAAAGALLARCAGEDKYFGVIDAVFRGQDEIYRTGDVRGVLLRIAQSSGMTEAQFETCVGDEEAQKALTRRVDSYSKSEDITATPTFIINGEKLEGAVTLEQLDEVIQPMLKK